MPQESQDKTRPPWWAKLFLWTSPLILLLIVVAAFELNGHNRLQKAMQQARDIGGPITFADFKAGRYLYADGGRRFGARGYRRVVIGSGSRRHVRYLEKMGFRVSGPDHVLEVGSEV